MPTLRTSTVHIVSCIISLYLASTAMVFNEHRAPTIFSKVAQSQGQDENATDSTTPGCEWDKDRYLKGNDIFTNWELMKTVTIEQRKIQTRPVPREKQFCGAGTCFTSGHLLHYSFGSFNSRMTIALHKHCWHNKAPVYARGTWWCSWLRPCTTSWKVKGPIPGGEIVIFIYIALWLWGHFSL
jgi:hypothetical protein